MAQSMARVLIEFAGLRAYPMVGSIPGPTSGPLRPVHALVGIGRIRDRPAPNSHGRPFLRLVWASRPGLSPIP